MLYSGIDLHKHSLVIHTVAEDGALVREAELATARPASLTAYFATTGPGPHRAVVECLGSWYWVRDLTVREGIDLRLGHAKYLKAISYAKVKTDRVDARTLAQLLRVGLVPEAHMISAEHREVRDLLRARLKLVTRATRARHAIGGLFTQYNVRTPGELPELVQLQVRLLEEESTLLAAQVKRCERELRPRLLPRADVQRLVWIPGIGAVIAYTLVLEIDAIRRFSTVKHFHSYCRLVPVLWQETSLMEQREQLVHDARLALYAMTELCARYGITTKTGYKWLARFEEQGRAGLADRSHAPHHCPLHPVQRAGSHRAARSRAAPGGPARGRAWALGGADQAG